MNNQKPEYLYLHVPFCKSICFYCDFTHQLYRDAMVEKWLNALEIEINAKKINKHLKTIYIGGGTPSSLKASYLKRLLSLLEPFSKEVIEYTIEINPETLTEEKVQVMKEYGINRASIGYQAFQKEVLSAMNRHHTDQDVRYTVDLLHKYGIDNYSLDLMYGLPNTTLNDVKESVKHALTFKPNHLSLYSLIIEPGSVFGKRGIQPMDEDLEADMYEWIEAYLKDNGFIHYEVSNFAKGNQFESLHNKAYWKYYDFYGLSIGASGKEGHIRYENTNSMKEYLNNPLARNEIDLSKEDLMFEHLMMSLRLKEEGLDLKEFKQIYGISFDDVYGSIKLEQIQLGNLVEQDNHLVCTNKGFEILNTVLEAFL